MFGMDKKHIRLLVILVVVAVVGIITGRHFFRTEETRIRAQLRILAVNTSRAPGDGGLSLSLKNQRLLNLFVNPCRLTVPEYDIDLRMTPHQIAGEVFRVHSRVSELSLRFYDINIFMLSEQFVEVRTTANLQAATGERGSFSESVELLIMMTKEEDGEWRFASFEQVEILQR